MIKSTPNTVNELSHYASRVAAFGLVVNVTISTHVMAQNENSIFEEVIVTAEKRNENLQDLSQSVSVFSDRDLDIKSVRNFIDLSALAPGITVNTSEDFRPVISIRGVGNEGNQNDIVNPSVSFHLDGVYIASQFALKTDFLDVEQVEVLRGPQGTLFGQNSIGGAINVTSKKPNTEQFEGVADVAYGSFDYINVRSSINVPISKTFALRASVNFLDQDGTATNVTTTANNLNFDQFTNVAGFDEFAFLGDISPIGQKRDDLNNLSWRVRGRWEPTDALSFDFTAQQFDQDTNGTANFGLADPTPLRDQDGNRQFSQDSPSAFGLTSDIYAATATYNFPSFTLKALGSYQRNEIAQAQDNDRTDNAFVDSFVLTNASTVDAWVGEVNLVSRDPLFGKLDWVVGAFYFNEDVDFRFFELLDLIGVNGDTTTLPDNEFDPFNTNDPIFLLGFAPDGTDLGFQTRSFLTRESFSFYGQGTYPLSDTVSLTGGVRYSNDAVDSETFNFFTLPNGVDPVILEQNDTAFTGRVAIEYTLPTNQLAYLSYTRGHKPGGSNLTFGFDGDAAPPLVKPTFGEESVNAYELGVKGDYIGGRLRANLAAFYYDYKNLQFQATDPNVFQGGVDSIPQSEIYGIEAEFLAAITDNFFIEANIAFIETEITEDFLALDNVDAEETTNTLLGNGEFLFGPAIEQARADQIVNVSGNELAKTPNVTSFIRLNYTVPNKLGEALASFQWTHRGAFQQRIFNNPIVDEVEGYDLFNIFLSQTFKDNGFGVELVIRNLTDTDGINARFTDVFGVGATGDVLIPPRQFIVRVRYRF
ncbi:MAG: TonB-dependent receptor [Pseudomonadota bacterium]